MNNILIIVISISFSSLAHVFLRKGMKCLVDVGGHEGLVNLTVGAMSNGWVISGVVLHVLALAVWLVALSRVEVTFAYPFLALGYVFVGLLAWTWLGESMSLPRVVGMIIVVIGIIVLSRS